jgi:DNA-binding transcriptional ArsR family regulator
MVYKSTDTLDRTFAALADPTRRSIVARLAERRSAAVSELAAPFDMSLPAILKHLGVLADAGLVMREKKGRIVTCRLDPAPLRDAAAILAHYQRYWSERLDALADFVESKSCPEPSPQDRTQPTPKAPSRASRSFERSRRRPRPSGGRGRTRSS